MSDTILETSENITVRIEEAGELLVLHVDVHKWCLSTLKELYSCMARLEVIATDQGKEELCCLSQNHRFAELMGFEKIDFNIEFDGCPYGLYVYEIGD